MDFLPELLKQGLLGLVGGLFLWLYLNERAEHRKTQKEKEDLLEARRLDAKETMETVTAPLQSLSQTTRLIYDKLIISKRGR